jgi:hypothetical protein
MSEQKAFGKSLPQMLIGFALAVSSDTIAEYITKKLNLTGTQYGGWVQWTILVFLLLVAFWFMVVKNRAVREVVRALREVQHALKSVQQLSSQYEGLTLPITINGENRFPQWELPSVMSALARGVEKDIRAIYVLTPETFRDSKKHIAQEGEYFEACRTSASRIAIKTGKKTQEIIRRVFLVSEQVLNDPHLLIAARKLIQRHSAGGLFGVRVLCPPPVRPTSDFAIYDDNIVLKLELEMFERRISSGLVHWSRTARSNYSRTWENLWKSPEARTVEDFFKWSAIHLREMQQRKV